MKRCAIPVLAMLCLAGCDGRSVAPVSGRVTLDNQPLPNAVVLFQPIEGKNNPGTGSVGVTDAEGRYTLHQIQPYRLGAVIGWHRVTISRSPVSNNAENSLGPESKPLYTERCEVPPGGTAQADFHLTSRK